METTAEVLLHTKHTSGNVLNALVTIKVCFPRYILAEVNTYRTFSRCYSSSRAVPSKIMRDLIEKDPTIPPKFGVEKSGMNMGDELSPEVITAAKETWLSARTSALEFSEHLSTKLGIHKSVANRLTEPFVNINGVITAELGPWLWFLHQRLDKNADPAIQVLAGRVQEALKLSTPEENYWHVPYILSSEEHLRLEDLVLLSAARCARTSYTPYGEPTMDYDKDMKLANRLIDAGHFSPFEHQAEVASCPPLGNFKHWRQYRELVDFKSQNTGCMEVWLEKYLDISPE